jgi:lipopolysaccharide transport system ATP-binding protein
MSKVVLKVENISKQYRLGQLGTGTMSHDINRWWHKVRGKEDPYLKIGDSNDRSVAGGSEYVWSLKDINFEVEQGEVLGIIGKNGAGKSTLLKILSQVTTPTTGEFKAKGRIASLLEVGTGFHPDLSGRENVFLNGAILGMSKAEIKSKLDEIVDFSGVARYLDTPVKRYSSGMMVRLGFAVAAHLEPEILIVDEVLAVGDAEFQKKCLGKMKDVAGQGRTVLFVSHNMAAVKNLCTKGIILKNGQLIFSGDSDEACNTYLGMSMDQAQDSLELRKDRTGTGEIIIEQMYFSDFSGNLVTQLISGEYVKLNLKYKKTTKENLTDVFLGITIRNESDVIQTVIASDETNTALAINANEGFFEIEIPKLMLRGGSYSITFMISTQANILKEHKILDRVENALFFILERGDYWHNGNINRPNGYLQEARIFCK